MSLKQYILLVGAGTILAWLTWGIVLFTINPLEAGLAGFVLFYSSLAVAFIGSIALLGFGIRYALWRRERVVLREAATSFRQAILFTVVVVGSLILQSQSLLAWWNVLLFVGLVSILELFFLSSRLARK